MKEYIIKVTINNKHEVLVNADSHEEAKKLAREFYLQNNYFIEKVISAISTQVVIDLEKVINIPINLVKE